MKFKSVFDCHPGVSEIFVVDGMPFLNAGHAQSHSITTGKPVEVIKREHPADPEGEGTKLPADPKGEGAEPPTPKSKGVGKKGK